MFADTATANRVADRCSDIRPLVARHLETHGKSLGPDRCAAIEEALDSDDLERVHDLLVQSLFVLMDNDKARRLLGDVAFDCGEALPGCGASLH